MAAQFSITIYTPKGKIYEDKGESLVAPGQDGWFGVLVNHAPLIKILDKGIMRLKNLGSEYFIAMDSGILEVSKRGDVTMLADNAIKAANYDTAQEELSHLLAVPS